MAKKIYKIPSDHISHSQIELYQKCPKAYEFKYIIKPEGIPSSEALLVGSTIHRHIAELLVAKAKRTATPTKASAIGELESELSEKLIDLKIVTANSSIDVYNEVDVAKKLLEKWCDSVYREFQPDADLVEVKFEKEIGGYPVLMFVDAIDTASKFEVVDWKVTKTPKTQFDADNSLQLSLYSIATSYRHVAFCSLVKPKANSKHWTPTITKVSSTRTRPQLEWAEYIVNKVGEGIGRKSFPPCSPLAYLCSEKYCEFWYLCRGKEQKKYDDANGALGWAK